LFVLMLSNVCVIHPRVTRARLGLGDKKIDFFIYITFFQHSIGLTLPRDRFSSVQNACRVVLTRSGFLTLLLLRLTPLPFAPSNLFLGSIPGISFSTYFLATAIGFLRLCTNVFIGSQLRGMIDGEETFVERAILLGGAAAFMLAIGNTGRILLLKKSAAGKDK